MKNKAAMRSTVTWSMIFILLPLLISLLMYGRLIIVLRGYMEYQVSMQSAALGQLAAQKISAQLDELERVAWYYRDGTVAEETMGSSADRLLTNSGRISYGILRLGGAPLSGKELPPSEYPAVRNAFRGNSTVRYRKGEGLLFTVPIYNNGNIKYALYEFLDEGELFASFGQNCYGGQGWVALADGEQTELITISDDGEDGEFFFQEESQDTWGELREKMKTGTSAAAYCESGEGKEFLFVSETGQGSLYLVGRVPYEVVADGASSISVMTLLVFTLLLILLCIGTVNLCTANAKARESDELREAKRVAEEANKSKGKFLANMSHELRTPINVILGMDEMILREETGEDTRERAMDIKSAAQILLGLINDVLDYSKIESGNLNILPVEYDLVAMIRDLVLLSENRARQKSLNFEMEIQPDLPVGLYGDDIHIRQIMINLLTNAVKYTNEGTVTLILSGKRLEGDGILLHCVVKDTGIGIKQEDVKKLFIPYSRIEERRNRNVEGTGLGLSIIINLLKLMGSELKLESVYGEGSAFYFDLEQKVVDQEPVGDIRKRLEDMVKDYKYRVSFIAPKARILMVDDNSMNRRLFVSLLKKTQIHIATVSSGRKALDLVQKEHFDLIFMDYLMPEMDGAETLRNMRKLENNLCKDVPVVALTANAFSGAKEQYVQMGFDDFLSKPIVTEKLEQMIQDLLPEDYISDAPEEKEGAESPGSNSIPASAGSPGESRFPASAGSPGESRFPASAGSPGESRFPASAGRSGGNEGRSEITAERELPAIEGVNWEYARLFLKDREILLDALQDYYENIDTECRELSALAEEIGTEEGLASYRIRVHSLKSGSAMVGILSVSELAKLLEFAARDGEREKIAAAGPLLLEELAKMKEHLRPFMKEIPGAGAEGEEEKKPLSDNAQLFELFEMLRFSMKQMDIGGADVVMSQLQSHSYPPEIQEAMDRLAGKVAALDYDGAEEEMDRMAGMVQEI